MRAGLRQVRIHDLRHTYASLLIEQGESLAYVRDQLGHYSIQITVRPPGSRRNVAAIDRLEDPELGDEWKQMERPGDVDASLGSTKTPEISASPGEPPAGIEPATY
jgi:hypothetical protein